MKTSDYAFVVRTSFGDDLAWERVVSEIRAPRMIGGTECFAYVKVIDDQKYNGLEPLDVIKSLPDDYSQFFVFVVDERTLSDAEWPVLVINFLPQFAESYDVLPRNRKISDIETLRAIPSTIQSIENNLSIANMGFEEYAESADADGVFRGFPRSIPGDG